MPHSACQETEGQTLTPFGQLAACIHAIHHVAVQVSRILNVSFTEEGGGGLGLGLVLGERGSHSV